MPAFRTYDSGDDILSSRNQSKKKRIPGACDICKRKKIRCDSGEMPGNRCSNCVQFGQECTHKEVVKTLGPAKGYVESLETRLEKMDKLLSKILPGVDVTTLEVPDDETTPLPRNDDDHEFNILATRMHKLRLNPPKNRFCGKSSGLQLIQTALDLRDVYISGRIMPPGSQGEEDSRLGRIPWGSKRREFWEVPDWAAPDVKDTPVPKYTYPPSDLIPSLVEHYFTEVNTFLPLLHRPTFLRALEEKKHLSDPEYGGTVLLVCALGARYSDDPRVFVEGSRSTRSAGWKWFKQVNVIRTNLFERTSLYELQMYALSVLFAQSTETAHGIWAQVGIGLRLAQEVGAHRRRRSQDEKPNAEDELWKRAFWVLMSLDRVISTFSGRPCGLQEEDFDLDLPIDCDDEYWDQGFQQPAGKPSTISYFNCYLSLMDILAYATRVIYPIRQPKNLFGRAIHHTDQQIIAELDSAMNSWMDLVPSHLRWNPNCADELLLKQSASLYATYYDIQIFIHRPFIPSPRNLHHVSFPSLAICTNAARSCCHVLESYSRLSAPLPNLQITVFQSAMILLLNIWSGKKSGVAPNPRREMEDVRRCMHMLKVSEQRWSSAGRFWDILAELAFAGSLEISTNTPPPHHPYAPVIVTKPKPPPDDSDSSSPASSATLSTPRSGSNPNLSEIPDRPEVVNSASADTITVPPEEMMNFSLPMYSNELGRLPIYGQFSFSDPMNTFSGGFPVNEHSATTSTSLSQPSGDGFNFLDQSPVMNFSAPRNLFTVADAFVKDALFNSQMSGGRFMFQSAQAGQPPPVDLSSIFTNEPVDFGDMSQFYGAQSMNADTAPAHVPAAVDGVDMPTGIVGMGDCIWPQATNVTSYNDLVDFDGFLNLQQQQQLAPGFFNDRQDHLNM